MKRNAASEDQTLPRLPNDCWSERSHLLLKPHRNRECLRCLRIPVQENKRANTQHRSISGSFHERRVSSTGRGGGGNGFENKPGEARSPGDSARGLEAPLDSAPALGAPVAETPLGGPGPDPHSWTARLRPHCLLEVMFSPLLPHPPKYPSIAPNRQPLVTPTPTRPRWRPLQVAVEDAHQATSSDASGDSDSGQRGPGGRQQLGRGLSPGAAGAGPPAGSASAPHEQSGPGARGAGGGRQQGALTGGRAGAGGPGPQWGPRRTGAPHRGRAGDREGATGAASAAGPGSPAAGDGAAGRA